MSSSSHGDPDPPRDGKGGAGSRSDVRPAPPAKGSGLSKKGMSTLQGTGPLEPVRDEDVDSHEITGQVPLDDPSSESELELDSIDIERVTLVDLPEIAKYDRYELIGRIAYGGMAEIFLAREMGHEHTRRMMVVKRVLPHVAEDEQFVDMFIDEARLAMQLNHPNICHVYNFGEAEGTYYIAMEWVNGKPLSQIIRRARDRGGIPIPLVLKIIAQVAEALDYAHRACDASGEPLGVVHRDVSPQNIMVSYDGVVKLLDFGIAKATSHSTRTEAGVIKGKFAYMSPQQCVGEPIDSRADIFALGICLYEALTAKHAFKRKTEFETMTKIVGDPAPKARDRRPDVPEAVENIIQTALMKQPERRYQTAGDMQLAIESVLPTLGTPVNSSRIGEYVSALFPEDVRDGPALDTRLTSTPPPKKDAMASDPSVERGPPPPGSTHLDAPSIPSEEAIPIGPRKKSGAGPLALLGVGCLLLALAGAGAGMAWLFLGMSEGTPEVVDVRPPPPTPDPPPVAPPVAPPTPMPEGVEPPASTTGSVMIESVPPGATIAIGERDDAGETPLEVGMLEPGTYPVRLSLDGHRDFEGEVTIVAGERATVVGELRRIPVQRDRPAAAPPGQLSLNTRPWSKVYLGRRLLGTTPLGRVQVPSGTQRLRLVDRDGAEHTRAVRIPPGEHVSQAFDLRD